MDGAHMGIKPIAALRTILGGEPVTDERLSVEQLREAIMAAPGDMPPVQENQTDEGYDLTCLIVAKQVLQYLEAHPEHQGLSEDEVYDTIKENDPHAKEVFEQSGMTGFMWGWSLNAARRCLNLTPVPNPAILEVN